MIVPERRAAGLGWASPPPAPALFAIPGSKPPWQKDDTVADFGTQRLNMVESQVRPSDVTDRHLMRAMLDLPREAFVPEWARAVAYADDDLAVSRARPGQPARFLLAPRILAKLIQAAELQAGDRVLDVGCATGYSTAVLARLAHDVVGLEESPELAAAARLALQSAGLQSAGLANARIEQGVLARGWTAAGPYDVIVLNGSVPDLPGALLQQLKEGGRLVGIVAGQGTFGTAQLRIRRGAAFASRTLFDAGAPRLPGVEAAASFAF